MSTVLDHKRKLFIVIIVGILFSIYLLSLWRLSDTLEENQKLKIKLEECEKLHK